MNVDPTSSIFVDTSDNGNDDVIVEAPSTLPEPEADLPEETALSPSGHNGVRTPLMKRRLRPFNRPGRKEDDDH